MANEVVGRSIPRVDAVANVTGKVKFTGDFIERDMLIGKILRSSLDILDIKDANIIYKHFMEVVMPLYKVAFVKKLG
jgi:xanthine dehydrogenase molybdenum-binding subunit